MNKLLIICLLAACICRAQDPVFTMGYFSSMHLNPALTGYQNGVKTNSNLRIRWPNLAGNFITHAHGAQIGIEKIKAGVGLLASADLAGNVVSTVNIGLNLSKTFALNDKLALSIGTSFNFQQKSIDWSKLTFSDMLDAKYGFTSPPIGTTMNTTVNYFNFCSGVLFTYTLGNIGFTASNINQPNQSFFDNHIAKLPVRYTMHATHDFNVIPGNILVISPSIITNYQQDFQSLISGVTTRCKWLKAFTGYSTANAVILGTGVQFPYFSMNYLYEITISELSNTTGGSHEVALSVRFGKKYDAREINAF
ncbi:MAG: PorP/SprF family type IX secretion system membrane protein [Flavobacteriales bacterium]